MRLSLRWKIMLITVLTPLTLGLGTWFTVDRNVREHVNSTSIHENLERSALVFESMLAERSHALEGGARVIAQDPRFFSLLTLGPHQRDSRFIATVRGMANDFNQITQTYLFEVLDRSGHLLASVGNARSTRDARNELVERAVRGHEASGVMIEEHTHYQATAMPVYADHQIVGVLLLGAGVGETLARVLRAQMRCEVTFISGHDITGTTLDVPKDRAALLAKLSSLAIGPSTNFAALHVFTVEGPTQTYLTLVRRLPASDASEGQMYVIQRSYDPETSFLHKMQQDMLILALLALVIALVTGLLYSEQLIRPLQQLVWGAHEMQQGNYNHPVEVRSGDELGFLAERFNEMRQRERTYVNSLEEATRLKSEFISVASHELRTPISVIRGYHDLLAEGTLGPVAPSQRQALEAIGGCLDRLTRIAQDATHVAEMKGERLTLDVAPHEVTPLIERAVGMALAAAQERHVTIESEVEPDLGPVYADGTRLPQAIMNLIVNGVRYTRDGGWVRVRAFGEHDQLVIEVRDNGVGIPEEKLGHIFGTGILIQGSLHHHSSADLEFNSSGLGLGLSLARGIVEAHGGTVRAESEVGKGSVFVIRMPFGEEAALADAA
jgi:signal transduction histidine kinase